MRILIVEDDEFTNRVLTDILAGQNYAIESARDGRTGWDLVKTFTYDLILLDVVLPGLDGISFCRQLRSDGQQVPVLLLTGRDSSHDKAIGLDAGADDYVVKPFDPEELVARIRALLRRSNQTAMPILEWGRLRLDPSSCEAFFDDTLLPLTPKEYALLELFLRNSHRVFSCGMILEHLWSFQETPGEEAVRTHIKGLRQKLKAVSAPPDLIENVYGIGYRLKSLSNKAEKVDKTGTKEPTAPKGEPNSSVQQQTLAAIAGVWDRFKDRIFAQVDGLEQAAATLNTGRLLSSELYQQAEQDAHTLAGSLATFGFPEGSKIARKIEQMLRDHAPLGPEEGKQLGKAVKALRQTLEPVTPESPVPFLEEVNGDEQLWLLIVDGDRSLVDPLIQEAEAWGLRTSLATTLTEAREILTQHRPDGVLLDPTTPQTSTHSASASAGLAFLAELSQRVPPLPVLVFTTQDRLVDRLEVARRGGRAFLHKPLPPAQIMETVCQSLKRSAPQSVRVMVVDDDPKILATLRHLLAPWGLRVTTLDDPRRFWEVLEVARPDLLILDIKMPHVTGIELCQVVRNDTRWAELPVLFLTAHTDAAIVNQVFAVNGDDFITKPIAGPELVARILNRVERIQLLRRLADTDPLTGVLNRTKSTQLLEEFLSRSQEQQQPCCFGILTVHRLREINKAHGHILGDAVLHRAGQVLQRSFRGEDVIARWGGEEFIIGMYGMNRREGAERLKQVLQTLHQEKFSPIPHDAYSPVQVTFSAGVAEYPEDGITLQTLYCSADNFLHEGQGVRG
ncbi:MAG: response regulator [Leptolyngbyaceae cyanobacterium bins.59]|nr:response regulator [Leptolyngbyaceae cyanobacterium bins.59]